MGTTGKKSVTCTLTSPELQKRKATVIAELKTLILDRQELTNGFSYTFSGSDENLDKLNSFIKTERACCDFLVFQIRVEKSVAVLSISGGDGAKEFLREEIGL